MYIICNTTDHWGLGSKSLFSKGCFICARAWNHQGRFRQEWVGRQPYRVCSFVERRLHHSCQAPWWYPGSSSQRCRSGKPNGWPWVRQVIEWEANGLEKDCHSLYCKWYSLPSTCWIFELLWCLQDSKFACEPHTSSTWFLWRTYLPKDWQRGSVPLCLDRQPPRYRKYKWTNCWKCVNDFSKADLKVLLKNHSH